MMDNRKYVFIGNRFFVLQKMMELKCQIIDIFAVKDSYLEKELINRGISYRILTDKKDLVEKLMLLDYDILVSNGCPYILPISELQKGDQKYINIHPSLLPDLKGKNPINGALLFGRKHGVTCHYMDDGIDTGAIIAQIEIPMTHDLDLELLYQITFREEGEVFQKALDQEFRVNEISMKSGILPVIYYSRCDNDMLLQESDSVDMMMRRIRAFSVGGLYARFEANGIVYRVKNANVVNNPQISEMYEDYKDDSILIVIQGKILVKFKGQLLWLSLIDTEGLHEADRFLDGN